MEIKQISEMSYVETIIDPMGIIYGLTSDAILQSVASKMFDQLICEGKIKMDKMYVVNTRQIEEPNVTKFRVSICEVEFENNPSGNIVRAPNYEFD